MSASESPKYNIYFSDSYSEYLDEISYPAILFSRINDSLNDFGFKIRYTYVVFDSTRNVNFKGELLLGFLESKDLDLNKGYAGYPDIPKRAEKLPQFFTQQNGMKGYREFVSRHGEKPSIELLVSLNDLVVHRQSGKQPSWYKPAINSEVFRVGFMRNSEDFYAYNNADSILNGTEKDELDRISSKLRLEFNLLGFANKHILDFNFDLGSALPKRINVLIGPNGVGKSQTLYSIVRSLLRGDKSLQDPENGRPMINRVLALTTPGETMNSFPPERRNGLTLYKRLLLNRSSRSKYLRGFGELCVRLVRADQNIGSMSRWEIFLNSLRGLEDFENVVVPLGNNISDNYVDTIWSQGKRYIPLMELQGLREQSNLEAWAGISNNTTPYRLVEGRVFPLSSGQLTFLKFALQASLFVENGTLVLLDEPETHLHPHFISKFVVLLDNLLKLTGSIAIIATHSAYFVREVPRNQVLVFKRDREQHIHIQNPRLKTFGADIGSISYFVFGDEITNSLVKELIERLPNSEGERIEALKELEDELSSDVLMFLRRTLQLDSSE
jgi:energy-coupling factor transporter ATP-binding protein EcfA2